MKRIVVIIVMIILLLSFFVQTIYASDTKSDTQNYTDDTVEKMLNDYLERKPLELMSIQDYIDMKVSENTKELKDFSFTKYWESNFGKKFGTNKYGMSIDRDGFVVLATATYECLRDTTVGCDIYNTVPKGYSVWSYGDEIEFTIDIFPDEVFYGKVYDSCGACFWKEKVQRIDIHMRNDSFGKPLGKATFKDYEGH